MSVASGARTYSRAIAASRSSRCGISWTRPDGRAVRWRFAHHRETIARRRPSSRDPFGGRSRRGVRWRRQPPGVGDTDGQRPQLHAGERHRREARDPPVRDVGGTYASASYSPGWIRRARTAADSERSSSDCARWRRKVLASIPASRSFCAAREVGAKPSTSYPSRSAASRMAASAVVLPVPAAPSRAMTWSPLVRIRQALEMLLADLARQPPPECQLPVPRAADLIPFTDRTNQSRALPLISR